MKESINMRNRVIYFVLFMLTFTVVHDTVINVIHNYEHTVVSDNEHKMLDSETCETIDEIHGMFHFVGLIMPYKSDFMQPAKKETLSHRQFQYSPPFKKSSFKPPKA